MVLIEAVQHPPGRGHRCHRAVQVLAITDTNISRAADLLGMTRPTLYDLMDRYGLRSSSHATNPG